MLNIDQYVLIRGCCTGYIYIFTSDPFVLKKKETVLSKCDEQAPFISLRQILETKMVSFFFFFWNNNMEVPYFTQYHRLRTSMNVHQCVTYANISGISVQFLFICDHENEVYRNFVCAFYLQIIMINGVSPCHTTLGSFYACNLFVFDHVCVHAF